MIHINSFHTLIHSHFEIQYPLRAKVNITVNGEPRSVSPNISIAELLVELEKNPKFLAVECNQELVPRGQHADHQLSEGDVIEIVTLVGGG